MAHNQKSNSNSGSVPFFARYLEGQIPQELSEEDLNVINGGGDLRDKGDVGTDKYPSDSDEAETQKYPSDSDEVVVSW